MASLPHSLVAPRRSIAIHRRLGAAVAVAMHIGLVAGLLTYAPARNALFATAPIMVDFIVAPEVEKPLPLAEPTKPKPVTRRVERPVEPPPVLNAPADTHSPAVTAVLPPPPPAPMPAQASAPQAPPAPAPLPVSQPVFNADYLENPAPAYPPIARRNGEQGRVTLRVLVTAEGAAGEVQVQSSSGSTRLDDSARDTVRRWKFVPARRGAQTVPAWVLIPISFKLDG